MLAELTHAFKIQLDNARQREFFDTLALRINTCPVPGATAKDIFHQTINDLPEFNSESLADWVQPFIEALDESDFMTLDSPVCAWVEHHLLRTMGNSVMAMRFRKAAPVLDDIPAEELAMPHMQWLTQFVERATQCCRSYPEIRYFSRIKIALYPADWALDKQTILALYTQWRSDWDIVLSLYQYVESYVESRDKFFTANLDDFNETQKANLISTINAWEKDSVSDVVDGLCRNYDISDMFIPQLTALVEAVREDKKSA